MGINSRFIFTSFYLIKNSHIFLKVNNLCNIISLVFILKNSLIFCLNYLIDLFVTDYLFYIKRFKVCYNMFSTVYCNNFYVMYSLKLIEKAVTFAVLFKSALWMEREAFDMFGIIFSNNWDLRRILTDYTFFGFPLRKDFPLTGYLELYYNEIKKITFETLVELMQEMRFYILSSFIELWDNQNN